MRGELLDCAETAPRAFTSRFHHLRTEGSACAVYPSSLLNAEHAQYGKTDKVRRRERGASGCSAAARPLTNGPKITSEGFDEPGKGLEVATHDVPGRRDATRGIAM